MQESIWKEWEVVLPARMALGYASGIGSESLSSTSMSLEALSISHHTGAKRRSRAEPFVTVGFYRRCPWAECPGVAVLGFGKRMAVAVIVPEFL